MRLLAVLFLLCGIKVEGTYFYAAVGGAASVDNTFQYIQSWNNSASAGATTIAVTVSGITSGNLLVAWVTNESANTNSTVAGNSSGTWTSATNRNHGNNDMHGRFSYLLSGDSGDTTITATFSASSTFRKIIVSEWRSSTTAIFDAENGTTGSSATLGSGNITTAGAGLILAGATQYDGATLSLPLIGTNSGVNIPDAELTSRVWAVQTSGATTAAASGIWSFSSAWIGSVLSFKGTGADSTTGTNYAHFYADLTNQTSGATLTTTILGNGSHGDYTGWTLTPATPTGFRVANSFVNKTSPLIVGTGVYNTGDASKSFEITNSVTLTYSEIGISDHARLTVSGFITIGANGALGGDLYDLVFVRNTGSQFATIQYNQGTDNLGIETNPGGVTTHSTGFTASTGTTYKFNFFVDFKNTICKWTAWNSAGTQVVSENATLATNQLDIAVIRLGQGQTGTDTLTVNKLEHIMVDYWARYPVQP